jgi:hypothetical protein
MRRWRGWFCVVLVLPLGLAACGGTKMQNPASLGCADRDVRTALDNAAALKTLRQGAEPRRVLRQLEGQTQRAPLMGPGGEVWQVQFYPVGVPSCAYVWPRVGSTPVVVDETRAIRAVGRMELERLEGDGWQLQGMAWDWGAYDYGYLPMRPALRSAWW